MLSLSNGLSFLRAPLAFLFLQENLPLRISAIILAMITDSIDGYLARRHHATSKFGAILDPAMDKFFVYFILTILVYEQNIKLWHVVAMVSRDFFLCFFGIYLFITARWRNYIVQPVRWGKVTTAMQFIVLIGITLGISFSWFIYSLFVIFGFLAFIELFQTRTTPSIS